jgi:hypothetical protein
VDGVRPVLLNVVALVVVPTVVQVVLPPPERSTR